MKMHPSDFFPPHHISLYTRGNQKVCIFFTIVLAMMFDGLSATQQIHQEEQALEKKKQFLSEFSELISPIIKQTPHELCNDRELTLPFFGCSTSSHFIPFNGASLLAFSFLPLNTQGTTVSIATSFSRCFMNPPITESTEISPFF